jgi:predicted transposase YbfD/YdcC
MVLTQLHATLATLPALPPHALASLAAAFTRVPDPRRPASVRYPVAALLAVAVVALLANHLSLLAIAAWGRRQPPERLRQLGLARGQAPWQSTYQRLFRRLDADAVAAALTAHFAAMPAPTARGAEGVALDGKAQRGRRHFQIGGSPVHALSAYSHERGVVLAHEPITLTADKAEAELTVAPQVVARVAWRGRVLTGDAQFCQRALCQQVRAAGGDYLVLVKANQPHLHWAISHLFDPPPGATPPLPLLDRREVRTIERGHGRQDEVRHLIASTDLTGYLDWPGLAQVIRGERTWRERGQVKGQLRYAITSLPPTIGTPARLLGLKRRHWQIENGLHRSKDVTFGEDASLVHVGQGPTILAMLRDAAISLLHRAGVRAIAATLRDFGQQPDGAVALVCSPPPTHA